MKFATPSSIGKNAFIPGREDLEALAAIAKALAHPARLRVVCLLAARKSCIGCDIMDEIGLAQSTTSEHLRILKSAGVITGEIDGPRVCYSLNPAALEPLGRFIEATALEADGLSPDCCASAEGDCA
ncbi:MAG: metalloregulator ArsR/SmtB family transcription factor [Nitrospirota bacterium]|nr:metalloregulator ArsR/SmtB family transcription factor [Nitrospirota bacterium]